MKKSQKSRRISDSRTAEGKIFEHQQSKAAKWIKAVQELQRSQISAIAYNSPPAAFREIPETEFSLKFTMPDIARHFLFWSIPINCHIRKILPLPNPRQEPFITRQEKEIRKVSESLLQKATGPKTRDDYVSISDEFRTMRQQYAMIASYVKGESGIIEQDQGETTVRVNRLFPKTVCDILHRFEAAMASDVAPQLSADERNACEFYGECFAAIDSVSVYRFNGNESDKEVEDGKTVRKACTAFREAVHALVRQDEVVIDAECDCFINQKPVSKILMRGLLGLATWHLARGSNRAEHRIRLTTDEFAAYCKYNDKNPRTQFKRFKDALLEVTEYTDIKSRCFQQDIRGLSFVRIHPTLEKICSWIDQLEENASEPKRRKPALHDS